MSCDFDYLAEKLSLKFWTNLNTFRPKEITVFYRKQSMKSLKYSQSGQFILPKETFTVDASFSKISIDFFGFSDDRIFTIELEFLLKEYPSKQFKESFKVKLPVVNQTELHFKRPGSKYPDAITRRICTQAFKMTPENSNEEIRRCIVLEEFRLMSIIERYKIYGYVEMLQLFLDIENSFELDLIKKFSLNNAVVKQQSAISYKIDVSSTEIKIFEFFYRKFQSFIM